jgi:hypothetical protein
MILKIPSLIINYKKLLTNNIDKEYVTKNQIMKTPIFIIQDIYDEYNEGYDKELINKEKEKREREEQEKREREEQEKREKEERERREREEQEKREKEEKRRKRKKRKRRTRKT